MKYRPFWCNIDHKIKNIDHIDQNGEYRPMVNYIDPVAALPLYIYWEVLKRQCANRVAPQGQVVVYISGWLVRVQLDNWLGTIEVATRKGNLATQREGRVRHCAIRHTRRVDRQSSSHTGGNYDDMGEAQSKNSSWNHSGSASDCILILSPPAHFKTLHF